MPANCRVARVPMTLYHHIINTRHSKFKWFAAGLSINKIKITHDDRAEMGRSDIMGKHFFHEVGEMVVWKWYIFLIVKMVENGIKRTIWTKCMRRSDTNVSLANLNIIFLRFCFTVSYAMRYGLSFSFRSISMTTATTFDVDDDFDGKQMKVEDKDKNINIRFVRMTMDAEMEWRRKSRMNEMKKPINKHFRW